MNTKMKSVHSVILSDSEGSLKILRLRLRMASRLLILIFSVFVIGLFFYGGMFGVQKAEAAHTFDTSARAATLQTTNPATLSYTCGSGTTVLVVMLAHTQASRTGGALTYNGITMTQVLSEVLNNAEVGSEMWYLVDPPTGSAYTISVPNGTTGSIRIYAASFKAQSGYTSNLDVATSTNVDALNPSKTLTTTVNGDAVIGILADGLLSTSTALSHTRISGADEGAWVSDAQYGLQSTAGNITMTFTIASDDVAMIMAAFKEVAKTTTLASGTDPSTTTVAPESGIVDAGSFTFQTNSGTDSITSSTIILAGSGTPYSGLSEVRITSDDGATTYFSAISNPSSNTLNFSGGTPILVSTTQTQFKIRVTLKTHANMASPPGTSYDLSPYVSAWTGTNAKSGSDSNVNTLTIDNTSPSNVTATSTTPGSNQIIIEWTNPVDGDFSNVIVVKSTSTPNNGTPTEGSSPNVGDVLGNGTVIYNSNEASTTATGLTNGTTYYFKIWAKDTRGNYSANGVEVSDAPSAATISISGTCKQWDNSTNCASSEVVKVAVNNILQGQSTSTSGAANWTISGITQPNTGDIITVFLDGVAANNRAVAVAKYTSGSSLSGFELIERTLTIGAANNQTITNANLSQYDYSASTNDADLFFDVDASNNLTIDVGGIFSDEKIYVKTGNTYQPDSSGAQKIITTANFENNGTSTLNGTIWRLAGSWKNASNLNYSTSTIEFGGTGTIEDTSGVFYKLTASSTASITATSTFAVSNVLEVATSGVFSINSGKTLTSSSTIILNGTISGSGTFKITSNNVPTGGTLSANTIVDLTSVAITIPSRTFGANLTILNTGTTNRTATAAAGTIAASGNLDIQSTGSGTITLDAATNSASATITGSLSFTGAGGTRTISTGSSANTWAFAGDVNLTGGTYTAGSGNTLKMSGAGTLTTNATVLKNLEINSASTVNLVAATHTVSGNLVLAGSGTPTVTGSTISMTGAGTTITGGGKTLNNLTIDPSSGTITLQSFDLTVSGTLNIAANDTLSIADSINLVHSGATLTLNSGSVISGAGKLIYRSSSAFPTAGTISSILRFDTLNNNQTMSARAYGGQIEIYNNTASSRTVTMAAGTHSMTNLYVYADADGGMLLDGQTNNATTTIAGNFYFLGSGNGTENITASSSPWTISGNMDISGGNFSASSGNLNLSGNYTNTAGTFTHNSGTIILNGSSQQTLNGTLSGSSAFNNLTITNNSGSDPDTSPSVIFSATTTANTFTAATASVKIRFNASSTYAFTNINFNGQATTTRVALRSSASPIPWFLNVPVEGSKTVSKTDVKDSDASLGDEIPAADGTNLNSGGNSNWAFSITSPGIVSVNNEVFEINSASTAVSDIDITSGGGSPGGRIASSTDIRIVIPAGFNTIWDNSINSITCSAGDSCVKILTTGVSYESGNKIAVINAIQNFQNGDNVRISGLKMTGFTAINASTTADKIRVDGVADGVDDASDTKTKAIKGKVAQQNHTASQQVNLFGADAISLTNADLFRFQLVPTGENASITTTTIALYETFGFVSGNITNTKLYQDTNNDGDVDIGESQLGGNGTSNIANASGTIVFGGSWTLSGTTNVILRADVSGIDDGDYLKFSLASTNINSKGATTIENIIVSGSSASVSHSKPQKSKGGGASASEGLPPAAGSQTGGGSSGGPIIETPPPSGGQTGGGSGGGGGGAPFLYCAIFPNEPTCAKFMIGDYLRNLYCTIFSKSAECR